MIADATEDQRKSSMAYSKRYFNEVFKEIDPDQIWTDPDSIWLDLCRGTEHAKNYCRLLLRSYVEESVEKFVVLGPEEYEWRRTVNSASSVTQYWRELIAEADATVLRDQRRKDPENYDKWRLKFLSHTHQRGQGPVFEISQWIFQTLAKELNLAVTLTFEKIEATDEDTVVLLNTLWQRADDIPCRPSTRLSFHGTLLLAAIGGFRRGTIERLRYRDVCLAVVRDPNDRSKTKLVVTPTIGKNKLRRATRVSRATEISFSMTLVPYSTICLASTVAARAIKDDAFKPSFESVEALLSRPTLESVDFLPLKWKEDMLDRSIFHLSNTKFYKLWHRTCLVAGLREDPRFYTMRVGCGGRLDGVLTDALRNYILSNTTGVFQGSYQPKRVREDLMRLAFGPMAGRNDCLFQRLRSMSLRRDADAPIDLSVEDVQEFEKRNDVSNLRASLKTTQLAGDKKEAMSIKSRVEYLIETLSSLKVKELRDAYFDRVDSLRARGLPTLCSSEESGLGKALSKKRGNGSAAAIAEFLQRCTYDVDEGSSVEQRSKVYMNLLVDYLAHRPQPGLESEVPKVEPDPTGWQNSADVGDEKDDAMTDEREQSRCLLCNGSFRGRSELTKHYHRLHVKNGTFDWPFSCPECLRQGMADTLIEGGAPAWSNHVERVHGKIHAPNLPSYAHPLKGSARCLLCEGFFVEGGGLTRHIWRTHDRKEGIFKQPFLCPECRRQGKGDVWIDGRDAWYDHVASVHGNQPHSPDSLSVDGSRQDFGIGKRKRDDENMVADF
ncbi:hypothetical protein EJ04DRAFT_16250 [Polyplosphaeria fusca]|uniref:C2H2-type domain-containing protein n=1 Tax=Polyplosphaeria fusca TaxID=682080 RepID=A0A9P4QR88_9PLEO|nr:hypothetical protein EJ04DRAFT_16250 [Polyplosphaeria fusca]